LKTDGELASRRIELDTRNQNERAIAWTLSALNKQGYDEIELIYDNHQVLKQIQALLKDLFVGFVIINQTKSRCVIRCVTREAIAEFDVTLRRAFMVTLTLGENLSEALKANDLKSIESARELEKTNNQLTNFCERLLNKIGHQSQEKICFYYVIIWNLEKVADDYKYLCEILLKPESKRFAASREFLALLDGTNSLLKEYYEIFYRFELARLSSLADKGRSLITEGTLLFKSKQEEEIALAATLISLLNKILDFTASTIAINS
jgi:phosphate uptake regulator